MNREPIYGGFLQFAVVTADPDRNLAALKSGLDTFPEPRPALIVLPELWSCGFDYPRMIEHCRRTPDLLAALADIAGRHDLFFAGSMPERDGAMIYNTMFLVGADGVIAAHRKSRLFAPMGEDRFFTPGPNPVPWDTPAGIVAPLVCFELRFPELARVPVAAGAFIILISAQWPEARIWQWELLLKARAVENQAFVIAANACGNGVDEPGGRSMVIGPDGMVLAAGGTDAGSAIVEIDMLILDGVRRRFSTVAAPAAPYPAAAKIVDRGDVVKQLAPFRRAGKKVVFTNGCFDILHPGHVTYLEEARSMGDCLVLGLNSDASVRRLKGEERPVNDEMSRARVIAALACVDFVVIFAEDTPLALIKTIGPDILVKGGDWQVEDIVGGEEVMAAGGRVFSIPLIGRHSTTGIINGIRA